MLQHYNNNTTGYGNIDDGGPVNNTESSSYWAAQEKHKSRRSKYIVIGSIVGIALLIAGIVAGVEISKSHKKSSSSSSSPSPSSTTSGTPGKNGFFNVVQQSDPNDPSTFTKNSNLHNSFYGFAYTPYGSQIPDCGANLPAVIEDMQIISQLTTRIRLYGADCNQSELVLDAIQRTKVNLQVYLGNYVLPGDDAGYTRQRDEITDAIKKFGTDHIAGITVGNEFMLNYLNAHSDGSAQPNSDIGNQGAQYLISKIQDTRTTLQSLSLSKTIPVGNADAGAYFNNEILAAVDYGMANVHPWFANQTAAAAASWTTGFFQDTDIAASNNVSNKPQMSIAETGWPTQSNDAGNESNGFSTASDANLQTFMDTFVCSSNTGGINYFFFEVFDEPWKNQTFGGVEGYWGIFNFNKTLKALTLPTCDHP